MTNELNSRAAGQDRISGDWKSIVAKYQKPELKHSLWQVANTLIPYAALWCLMYFSLSVGWWLTLLLAILAGGFLVRMYIIFHDCGHGAFFKSRTANDIMGFVTGVLTFTPYHHWRWLHAQHHSTSGNLDKRGVGDIWTMTVREYSESPLWKRIAYRTVRNPVVLFGIGPFLLLVVLQRFTTAGAGRRERLSVYGTNLAIVLVGALLSMVFSLKVYVILQLVVVVVGGTAGIWLFYVQHQFEGVYWKRHQEWDHVHASLQGSSFYKLPKVLQWFSGNIGFHHVHHLSHRIPNYKLEECHNAEPIFQTIKPITLLSSLKSLKFRLWDEEGGRLVGYEILKRG